MPYEMKVYEVFADANEPLKLRLKDTGIYETWASKNDDTFAAQGSQAVYKQKFSGAQHRAWIAVPANWDMQDRVPAGVAEEKVADGKLIPTTYRMNGHLVADVYLTS